MRIDEFQDLMRSIYFKRDAKRGAYRTFIWLVEETGELARAINKKSKAEMNKEFSDVAAWLFSLANILGVDMEKALKAKYGKGCPKCKGIPCRCSFK